MIRANRATFIVYSGTLTVAEISSLLHLVPSRSGDIGDLTRSGKAGRNLAPERLRREHTFWSLESPSEGIDEDETGFSALRALVATLLPHADALAHVRERGETLLAWRGDSDSSQGGFVIEADLIRDLACLGCSLYGTAYLDEEPSDD